MKTEISRDSHQPEKRYSGVYQQQGRMLTDADWNELVEILKRRQDEALKDIVGSNRGSVGGTPRHLALAINTDLTIKPGFIYVDGTAGSIPGETDITVTDQDDFPDAPALANDCIIYADLWERTVTSLQDETLRDKGLHGADTCTRKEILTQIKWCPEGIDPESASDNPAIGSAPATITLLKKSDQPDLCDPCAEQHEVESRIGNYLFRVEIHDVQGPVNDPTKITLKWSAENGAIQYSSSLQDVDGNDIAPPPHFTRDKWVYEFFDETSEKHLGLHHVPSGTWNPSRGQLTSSDYSKPASSPNAFVRRWDGYCTLSRSSGSWSIAEQHDKSQSAASEFVHISGQQLTIALDALEIAIDLSPGVITGDYWLAEVREAVHQDGDELISNELPHGCKHSYLTLGKITAGILEKNPQQDRKYGFAPLTEMTRMFIAGGDGQEVVPGTPSQPLPQPLRVAVANGEWPVSGATVRFQTENGSLTPADGVAETSSEGIAQCIWTPGDVAITPPGSKPDFTVKVTLVSPDNPDDDLDHPPLYFHAGLVTADQVAYTPGCLADTDEETVHHLLPGLNTSSLGEDGFYTVKEVLDELLCELKATHLPVDRTGLCPKLTALSGDERVNTVQDAINALCQTDQEGGGCCTITISPGDDLEARLTAEIGKDRDAHICITAGEYLVKNPLILEELGNITIEGCGFGTVIRSPEHQSALILNKCRSVAVRNLSMQSDKLNNDKALVNGYLNGVLTILETADDVVVENVFLQCPHGGKNRTSCLTVAHSLKASSIRIRDCRLHPGYQQIGILLVNAHQARIADNTIKVRPHTNKSSLKMRLRDKDYNLTIRKMFLSDLVVTSKPKDNTRNTTIQYKKRYLHFNTPDGLAASEAWQAYTDELNLPDNRNFKDRELLQHLKNFTDTLVLTVASGKEIPANDALFPFKGWFDKVKSHLPAIASQGIVCGGRLADDICITQNSISGVAQGIHIGLSSNDTEKETTYLAERLLVEGNHIVNYRSSQELGEYHGIFIGNVESLHIENNYLQLEKYPFDLKTSVNGVWVYGYFGRMLQIRGNRLQGYDPGIFVKSLGTADKEAIRLWQVENNLLQGSSVAPVLEPQDQFIFSNNPH